MYRSPTDVQWTTRETTGKLQWIKNNRKPLSEVPMMNLPDWPMLMGQCYPCANARNRMHYGDSSTSASSAELLDKGFLAFTCPGGALGPQQCPLHEVALIDSVTRAALACDCMDGYYRPAGGGACVVCEAGYFCTFRGGRARCPLDSYSYSGFSACTPCTKNTGMCAVNMALTRCALGYQTQDARCVDCGVCQQVAPASLGAVPCYRLSSV
jgi:hypothetical protein